MAFKVTKLRSGREIILDPKYAGKPRNQGPLRKQIIAVSQLKTTGNSLRNRSGVRAEINMERAIREEQWRKKHRSSQAYDKGVHRAMMRAVAERVYRNKMDPTDVMDGMNVENKRVLLEELSKMVL